MTRTEEIVEKMLQAYATEATRQSIELERPNLPKRMEAAFKVVLQELKEPTEEMKDAGRSALHDAWNQGRAKPIWAAMLSTITPELDKPATPDLGEK